MCFLMMIFNCSFTFSPRYKSVAFATIRNFYNYVLHQFHISIQCLKCDNGKKIDNTYLRNFLASRPLALFFAYLVHIHHHKIGKLSIVSHQSMISCTNYYSEHTCLPHTGLKPCGQLPMCSTDAHPNRFNCVHHMRVSFISKFLVCLLPKLGCHFLTQTRPMIHSLHFSWLPTRT